MTGVEDSARRVGGAVLGGAVQGQRGKAATGRSLIPRFIENRHPVSRLGPTADRHEWLAVGQQEGRGRSALAAGGGPSRCFARPGDQPGPHAATPHRAEMPHHPGKQPHA